MDLSGRSSKAFSPLQLKAFLTPKQPGAGVLKPKPPLKALNTPAARQQSAPAQAPAPVARKATVNSSPYIAGGSASGSAGIAAEAPAPEPAAPSEEDFLSGDSGYQATLAALQRALQDFESDNTSQRTKYTTDYNDAVKQLGFRQDDPATPQNEGAWNFDDLNTASGRSFQNQQNDFASRGLLQSSLYGRANDDLTRSLNDQLGSVNTAKTNFFDELTRGLGAFKNENTMNQQQARAEALARRAATFGI